VRYRQ
jgi:hypothetical protein